MLEVIEHHQQLLVPSALYQRIYESLPRTLAHSYRPGYLEHHQVGVCKGGQRHEKDTVGKEVAQFLGGLQAEPRFADAWRAGQGEQAHILLRQQMPHFAQLALAPNERCCLGGQACGTVCPPRPSAVAPRVAAMPSSESPAGTPPLLAKSTNAATCSSGKKRHRAISSASCLDGLRSPASIFSMVAGEQPAHIASLSLVRSAALRLSFSQLSESGGLFCVHNSRIIALLFAQHKTRRPTSALSELLSDS